MNGTEGAFGGAGAKTDIPDFRKVQHLVSEQSLLDMYRTDS